MSADGLPAARVSRSGVALFGGTATHTGLVRAVNQDRIVAVAGRLYGVADGMGGHRAGEVAAEIAAARLGTDAHAAVTVDAAWLLRSIQAVNGAVFEQSMSDGALAGMGTTITALVLSETGDDPSVGIANVGDSRTYRLRAGELELLTEDHNVVAELVREGAITEEQARTHPRRSVMTRAIGVEPTVDVDILEVLVAVGDRFLLCSDGLHGFVAEQRIAGALRRLADPAEAARELVQLALAAGAPDNVSVVVVDVVSDGDAALRASLLVETDGHVLPPLTPPDHPTAQPSAWEPAAVVRPSHEPAPSRAAAGPRLFTARSLVFVLLLAGVAAVAVWAVRLGSSSPAVSTVPVTVAATVDPFADPSTSAGPATTAATATTVTPSSSAVSPSTSVPRPTSTAEQTDPVVVSTRAVG